MTKWSDFGAMLRLDTQLSARHDGALYLPHEPKLVARRNPEHN